MDRAPNLTTTTTTRLYALELRLRPLKQGTLMPFSGELVHGAFLRWLHATNSELIEQLHEGQKRRLFTCSSLQFNHTPHACWKAQRENIHLPLNPQELYTVRLTLLWGELFPLLHEALLAQGRSALGTNLPPFLQLGKQYFLLEDILWRPDSSTGWTGCTSLLQLVEQARHIRFDRYPTFTLEFASLTTFNRGSSKTGYGSYPAVFPLPEYIFQNLLNRWEDLAPPGLNGLIQREHLETYLREEGIISIDYDLRPHHLRFTTHVQRGFVGSCTYQLRGPDEKATDDTLTLRQQVYVLALLAFYTGIGYKTAMGLGQARLKPAA